MHLEIIFWYFVNVLIKEMEKSPVSITFSTFVIMGQPNNTLHIYK